MINILKRGVQAVKTKIEERKRLPDENKLSWLDKMILLLTCVTSYTLTGKAVSYIEGKLLNNNTEN